MRDKFPVSLDKKDRPFPTRRRKTLLRSWDSIPLRQPSQSKIRPLSFWFVDLSKKPGGPSVLGVVMDPEPETPFVIVEHNLEILGADARKTLR